MTQNLGRITDLEKQVTDTEVKFNEAVQSRDKVRDIVKTELNISEFTTDAVRSKLNSFASDDAIAARDKQFNDYKANSLNKIEDLESQLQNASTIQRDMKMQLAISQTDVMAQTKGEHATSMLMGWIGQDADFDAQGNIVYKGQAGETLFNKNGEPLTLDDRINEIKADESRDFIFQQQFLNGGGAPTNQQVHTPSGTHTGKDFTRTTMSFEEKSNYRKKYGEGAYGKLPLV